MAAKKAKAQAVSSRKLRKPADKRLIVKRSSFPIVGIGASAGGLEALEALFRNIPENTGMAFVIITHLDKSHTSILPEIMKRYTRMPVQTITSGIKAQPNTVYIIPPNKNVDLLHGIFQLKKQESPHFVNLPVNFFYKALAKECKENAIAIILSGLGSDGSLGIKYINDEGGLVIVQDPSSAKYNGMPLSAINTELTDYILPAEQIGEQLTRWLKNNGLNDKRSYDDLQKILIMLRSYSGHDFSSYKLNTINRRIKRQMANHHLTTLESYVAFLQRNTQEIGTLFKDILIGVTSFFRDPDAFEALKEKIISQLLRHKKHENTYRVWVPGCSTGEEVYSLAMVIHECMDEINSYRRVHIFGTDIDMGALEMARTGMYSKSIASFVSADRLQQFFLEEKNSYKVRKEIREMVVFGVHNLIKDTSFTKMDLISCRNLLIYFNTELQKRLFPIFHFSLKPKGLLFLGGSETVTGYSHLFHPATKKWKIFERKDSNEVPIATMNLASSDILLPPIAKLASPEGDLLNAKFNFTQSQVIKQYLLDHYLSHCLVINKQGEVLYSQGNTKDCLRAASRGLEFNVFQAILPKLKPLLVAAVRKVEKQKRPVVLSNLALKINGVSSKITMTILPLGVIEHLNDLICVAFDKVAPKSVQGKQKSRNKQVLQLEKTNDALEKKLQHAKESLQCTIEELQSSNEELQSTNEELQSTNEELETSKEEMQSLNEELVIVNTELQYRIDQYVLINDDMVNLFNSTGIMALFLDVNFRIKRFTLEVKELVNLIQADIGRSINDFSIAIDYKNLIKDAKEVLQKLNQKTFEALGKNGHWYEVRILPYKTTTNVIDGVIIIFTDISSHKTTQDKLNQLNLDLQQAYNYSRNIFDTVHDALLVITTDLKINSANKSFYRQFKHRENEVLGKFLYDFDEGQFNIPDLISRLEHLASTGKTFNNFNFSYTHSDGKEIKLILNARKIVKKDAETENDADADKILLTLSPSCLTPG